MSLENFSLKDRIAVVTGAGQGIGLEIARAFGEAGAVVIVAEIMEETGCAAARALNEAGYKAKFFRLDVTDSDLVDRVAEAIIAEYGHVDILVNNAGRVNNINFLDYWTRSITG